VLLAAVALAANTGFDACAWQLPWAIAGFLDRRGHWHEWAAVQGTALAAANRLGDAAGEAAARRSIGHMPSPSSRRPAIATTRPMR
jgi:hypothetical protein